MKGLVFMVKLTSDASDFILNSMNGKNGGVGIRALAGPSFADVNGESGGLELSGGLGTIGGRAQLGSSSRSLSRMGRSRPGCLVGAQLAMGKCSGGSGIR
jgi:hypothetical protein